MINDRIIMLLNKDDITNFANPYAESSSDFAFLSCKSNYKGKNILDFDNLHNGVYCFYNDANNGIKFEKYTDVNDDKLSEKLNSTSMMVKPMIELFPEDVVRVSKNKKHVWAYEFPQSLVGEKLARDLEEKLLNKEAVRYKTYSLIKSEYIAESNEMKKNYCFYDSYTIDGKNYARIPNKYLYKLNDFPGYTWFNISPIKGTIYHKCNTNFFIPDDFVISGIPLMYIHEYINIFFVNEIMLGNTYYSEYCPGKSRARSIKKVGD